MTRDELRDELGELNPEALLADGFEDAFVGHGGQFTRPAVALYDWDRCVRILMDRDEMTEEEAVEFMGFNVTGAWVGEFTPMFVKLAKP